MDFDFKYLTLLLLLFIIYLTLKAMINFPYITANNNFTDFLKIINNYYYIKNKSYVVFMLIFYFVSNFMIFLLLRLYYLGITTIIELDFLNFYLVNFFLITLIIQYYLKILHIIFYPFILQMHFYLYQFEFYDKFREWFSNNALISNKFDDIFQFFYKITKTKSEIFKDF